jgi:hypothetical protein
MTFHVQKKQECDRQTSHRKSETIETKCVQFDTVDRGQEEELVCTSSSGCGAAHHTHFLPKNSWIAVCLTVFYRLCSCCTACTGCEVHAAQMHACMEVNFSSSVYTCAAR